MGDSALAVRHATRVIKAVRGEQRTSVAPHVAKSWDRCFTEYGMQPSGARATAVLEASQLKERQQRLGELLGVARAEMESLYDQISGSGYAVILGDADATILHTISDPALKREFRHAGLWLGALWDERHEGTNGLGTCIAERSSVTVHRDEHFMGYNVSLSCSGAPIMDAHGGLLGVLDASSANCSDTRLIQRHTMALVNMSANLISRCHFLREFPQAYIFQFHSRPEFVGLLHEALIAVAPDGIVLAVNESALAQLGHPDRSRLVGRSIESVFQFAFTTMEQRAATDPRTIWPIRDVEHGRRFYALVRARHGSAAHGASAAVTSATTTVRATNSLSHNEMVAGRRHVGSDPSMQHNLNCAQQLFSKRVPILLQGATGTGKEAFARVLHNGAAWSGKPFVAVNCGAIPESLIESELFGYTRGAFTDADRHGRPGKILQSSGGTLFLDEIGDMPLTLQTRLLRVIEEFEIVPLGGDQAITVDLHVISASHRDIRQMVHDGEFREDLYYRLNGTTLNLPHLRDRADRAELIDVLLGEETQDSGPVRIQPDALHALLSYHWPGNIRQLRNVLRTAAALCRDNVIRLSNLPQELLDEAAEGMPAPDAPITVSAATAAEEACCRTPLDTAEHATLLRELERNRWNITHTADSLGVSRNTLYRKIRKHQIPLAE